jgi:very-short-patch-repair endonuclease
LRLAQLASAQHGAVTAAQLKDLGLSREQIGRRLNAGRLLSVHEGVYFVGHVPPSPLARYMAATLATGGYLSHRSAAALYGIYAHQRRPEVVTTTKGADQRGLRRHWTRSLDAQKDTTTRYGIPVTTLQRTLQDLADVLEADPFEALLRNAERLRLIDRSQLRPIHGRRGYRKLKRAHELTRSKAEAAFRKTIRQAKLKRPEYNAPWRGYEVDALWPADRLAVEIDGYDYHHNREAFRRDRAKQNALTAAGYRILRFTYEDVIDHPRRTATAVRRLLSA